MNRSVTFNKFPLLHRAALKRGLAFGGIILSALVAFEVFNFSSTAFALHDVLGDLSFGPLKCIGRSGRRAPNGVCGDWRTQTSQPRWRLRAVRE